MSDINDLIAELVGAAHQLDRLDDTAKRSLLERALTTIVEMRARPGISIDAALADGLVEMRTAATEIAKGSRSDEEIRATFLEAAGMIRDLYVVVDTDTQVEAREPDGGDPGNY